MSDNSNESQIDMIKDIFESDTGGMIVYDDKGHVIYDTPQGQQYEH